MPFDETRKCGNCLFHTEFEIDDPMIRCRFNAPIPSMYNIGVDMTKNNITRFPKCPGPACGQWQLENEPEIIEVEETVNEVSTIKE